MNMKVQSLLFALSVLLSSSATDAFFVPNTPAFLNRAALFASTLERLPDSAVKVRITAPGTATKAAYEKVCSELSKSISIAGFRKGAKIPPKVLEQAMAAKGGRNQLRIQAINSLLAELIEPALKEDHGLEPIGQPSLVASAEELAKDFTPGEDIEIEVKCDVWPDIQWKTIEGKEKPYVGLSGSYKRKPFDDTKFNKALNDLMERYATLEPIEDASHELNMGDACVVNMEGFMEAEDGTKGDPLPNAASGDRVDVVLGEGRYMTGLVEGLVGAKVGETRTVSVRFPDALRDKSLAGKKALFDVTVLEASKRSLPELTDEFAEKVRSGLTAESLQKELRKAVDAEDAKEFTPARNAALAAALAEVMDVDVPDTLVTNQARDKFALMMTDMRNSGVDDDEIKNQINQENFLKYKNIVKDDIVKDFKVSMATDEIARLEGIEIPDYQVQEQMEAVKKEAAGSDQEIDDDVLRAKIETTLQRNAVMDFLAEQADLTIEFTDGDDFDENLMNQLAEESMEREKSMAAVESVEVDTSAVEVKEEAPAATKEEPVDTSKMSLQEKAYEALKNAGALD